MIIQITYHCVLQLIVALGTPLKGHGETSRRGRRRHVSHLEYEKDGIKHMRQKFYIQGPHGKGTVQLECFMVGNNIL